MITTYTHKRIKGENRPASTYRAARPNAARGLIWKGAPINRGQFYHETPVRPNRSKKWAA